MTVLVLLVDDHAEFCRILRQILQIESDFFVVGEAEDGEDAYRTRARESGADAFLPKQDVITRLTPTVRRVLGGAQDQRHA